MVDTVPTLKSRALRVIELEFAAPVPAEPFPAVPGARTASTRQALVRCEVVGPVGELMRLAAARP